MVRKKSLHNNGTNIRNALIKKNKQASEMATPFPLNIPNVKQVM